jgi:hypothetical protein
LSKKQATENDGKSAIRFREQPVIGIGDKRSVMPPTASREWVKPVLALLLCLSAVALAWYGLGELFDNDLDSTGSLVEH